MRRLPVCPGAICVSVCPLQTFPPTPPHHPSTTLSNPHQSPGMCLLSPAPNYSIRRTRLQMTPLLQLIRGTWLRKLFLPFIETYTSGASADSNLSPAELSCRWLTEKPTDCQPSWRRARGLSGAGGGGRCVQGGRPHFRISGSTCTASHTHLHHCLMHSL